VIVTSLANPFVRVSVTQTPALEPCETDRLVESRLAVNDGGGGGGGFDVPPDESDPEEPSLPQWQATIAALTRKTISNFAGRNMFAPILTAAPPPMTHRMVEGGPPASPERSPKNL
jgi:hypothetical protein